jgi:hypothetical protein
MKGDDLLLFHLAALDERDGEPEREPGWARVEAALGPDLLTRVRRVLAAADENGRTIVTLPPPP